MFMLFSLHLNFAIYQAFDGQTERSQATNYVTLSYITVSCQQPIVLHAAVRLAKNRMCACMYKDHVSEKQQFHLLHNGSELTEQ